MPTSRHRVTQGNDYRAIVRQGRSLRETPLVLHARRAPGRPARFGFIVSKAVGNAVKRNLVRRRLKDIADRQVKRGFSDWDLVIRAQSDAAAAPFGSLQLAVERAISRLSSKPSAESTHM